jgi:hypothetical protein
LTDGDPVPGAQIEAARDRTLAILRAGARPVDVVVTLGSLRHRRRGRHALHHPAHRSAPLGTHEVRPPPVTRAARSLSRSRAAPGPAAAADPAAGGRRRPAPRGPFREEGAAGDVEASSDLPQAKHDELLKDKYRRGLAAEGEVPKPAPPRLRAGIRLGAGPVLLDSEGAAGGLLLRAGAGARYLIGGRFALQVEPAAQAILGEQRLVGLRRSCWPPVAAPARAQCTADGTRAGAAAVLAATVWRGFEAASGRRHPGGRHAHLCLLPQWDSGGEPGAPEQARHRCAPGSRRHRGDPVARQARRKRPGSRSTGHR